MPTVSKLMLEDVSTADTRTTPGIGHPIIAQDVTDAFIYQAEILSRLGGNREFQCCCYLCPMLTNLRSGSGSTLVHRGYESN